MTVVLEIPPFLEGAYQREADDQGLPLEELLQGVLNQHIPVRSGAALVAAMQASPFKEISLQSESVLSPVSPAEF